MIKMLNDDLYKIEPFIKEEKKIKSRMQISEESLNVENEEETLGRKGSQSVNTVLVVRFKVGDDNLSINSKYFVCVSVCVYACLSVCMSVCAYLCVCLSVFLFLFVTSVDC